MYCHRCDRFIDTDWDVEHFGDDGVCELQEDDECEMEMEATPSNGGKNGPNE